MKQQIDTISWQNNVGKVWHSEEDKKYYTAVETEYKNISNLQAIYGYAIPAGVEKILDYTCKTTEGAVQGNADEWYVDDRPNMPVIILVSVGESIINSLPFENKIVANDQTLTSLKGILVDKVAINFPSTYLVVYGKINPNTFNDQKYLGLYKLKKGLNEDIVVELKREIIHGETLVLRIYHGIDGSPDTFTGYEKLIKVYDQSVGKNTQITGSSPSESQLQEILDKVDEIEIKVKSLLNEKKKVQDQISSLATAYTSWKEAVDLVDSKGGPDGIVMGDLSTDEYDMIMKPTAHFGPWGTMEGGKSAQEHWDEVIWPRWKEFEDKTKKLGETIYNLFTDVDKIDGEVKKWMLESNTNKYLLATADCIASSTVCDITKLLFGHDIPNPFIGLPDRAHEWGLDTDDPVWTRYGYELMGLVSSNPCIGAILETTAVIDDLFNDVLYRYDIAKVITMAMRAAVATSDITLQALNAADVIDAYSPEERKEIMEALKCFDECFGTCILPSAYGFEEFLCTGELPQVPDYFCAGDLLTPIINFLTDIPGNIISLLKWVAEFFLRLLLEIAFQLLLALLNELLNLLNCGWNLCEIVPKDNVFNYGTVNLLDIKCGEETIDDILQRLIQENKLPFDNQSEQAETMASNVGNLLKFVEKYEEISNSLGLLAAEPTPEIEGIIKVVDPGYSSGDKAEFADTVDDIKQDVSELKNKIMGLGNKEASVILDELNSLKSLYSIQDYKSLLNILSLSLTPDEVYLLIDGNTTGQIMKAIEEAKKQTVFASLGNFDIVKMIVTIASCMSREDLLVKITEANICDVPDALEVKEELLIQKGLTKPEAKGIIEKDSAETIKRIGKFCQLLQTQLKDLDKFASGPDKLPDIPVINKTNRMAAQAIFSPILTTKLNAIRDMLQKASAPSQDDLSVGTHAFYFADGSFGGPPGIFHHALKVYNSLENTVDDFESELEVQLDDNVPIEDARGSSYKFTMFAGSKEAFKLSWFSYNYDMQVFLDEGGFFHLNNEPINNQSTDIKNYINLDSTKNTLRSHLFKTTLEEKILSAYQHEILKDSTGQLFQMVDAFLLSDAEINEEKFMKDLFGSLIKNYSSTEGNDTIFNALEKTAESSLYNTGWDKMMDFDILKNMVIKG